MQIDTSKSRDEIFLNFSCNQTEFYFQCIINNLTLLATDISASINVLGPNELTKDVEIIQSNIHFIPKNIFKHFSKVREFVAKNISIYVIEPDTFENAFNLRYLVLSFNNIQSLYDGMFLNSTELESIKLDHNELQLLSENIFVGLSELRVLSLSYNKISFLPLYLLKSLTFLEELKLDNNRIKVLSFAHFSKNIQLLNVGLYQNDIFSIENGTFDNLNNLHVDLRNNVCVNIRFDLWRKKNYDDLFCCLGTNIFTNKCMKQNNTNKDSLNGNNIIGLITVLTLSIFVNFFLILYFCYLKRRKATLENFELLTADSFK